jgi:putative membrane protein
MTDRTAYAVIALLTVVVVGLVGALMLSDAEPGRALDVAALPLLNACLNAVSAGLLLAGWVMIRQRRFTAHVACMAGAFAVSTLFLLSYVTYHYFAGSRAFTGQGWIRPVYFAILVTHIVLAAAIVPLALTTIHHGLRAFRSLTGDRRGIRARDAPRTRRSRDGRCRSGCTCR